MSFQARIRTATRGGRLLAAMLACGICVPAFGGDKAPTPSVRLSYQDLGFPGYAPALMRAPGYSMTTVHLLDSTHLLFTYSLRSLVPRLPGDDENDSDRMVAAEIVELPSGKVLAHTKWRLHDHGRYLWRAGQGVFVLRTAGELSTFAPLKGLGSGTAFQRVALPHRPGMPQLIGGSPDGAVLTVEVQRAEDTDPSGESGDVQQMKHTTIEFFRISAPTQPDEPIELRAAGPVVGSSNLMRLAVDGDGYLWAEDQGRSNWSVSFNEYGGKRQKLTTLHSSCAPRLSLLSRGEFLAQSCQGTDDAPMLAAYGFDGHENWQEPFGGDLQPPTLVTAPEVGRFAISRLVANKTGSGIYDLAEEDPLGQEIRVYQTESGDMLLHLQCATPVRAAENFDLSPDGRTVAVLGHDAVEIYTLPALTDRDRKDLADVQTMTPPMSHGEVVLTGIVEPVGSERRLLKVNDANPAPSPDAAAATATAGSLAPAGAGAPSGASPASATAVADAPADAAKGSAPGRPAAVLASQSAANAGAGDAVATPRKPPTLLAPGESPEFKGKDDRPQ